MRRRELILAAGVVALASPSVTGAAEAPYRIAVLTGASARYPSPQQAAFEEKMSELGYVEGRNLTIIFRTAAGRAEALPGIVAELIGAQPDAIVTVGPEATLQAVRAATDTIPIVAVAVDYDPVARGYASSLSRPGGNITGIFAQQIELAPKRLELLAQAVPTAKRIGVLADEFTADQLGAVDAQAPQLNLVLGTVELRKSPYDFARAMARLREFGADAVLTLMSPVFFRQRAELADALLSAKLPASFGLREFPEAGGLMSYGANLADMRRRAADYIDKLLKGAKPGNLPIEQPTKFEMIINLNTAKALGLTMPHSLLARADEVIE